MSKRKFITNIDGTLLRLMPQNYGVAFRRTIGEGSFRRPEGRWNLDIDPALPVDLAVKVFRLYHTDHEVRWGSADQITRRLNALL